VVVSQGKDETEADWQITVKTLTSPNTALTVLKSQFMAASSASNFNI